MGLRSSLVLAARVSAGLLLVASLIAVGARSAAAATCVPWFGTQPAAVGGTNNSLTAVASVSPCDAWAVGNYFAGGQQSFIHHWDGTAWEQTPNPNPGTNPTVLNGVAAVSVSDAWAVGSYGDQGANHTLIEHWDGKVWTQRTSPTPAGASDVALNAVAATSTSSAWAVGDADGDTLILRWNGTAWKRVPSPSPGGFTALHSVAATSPTNAWAVGDYSTSTGTDTFIVRWNGTAWRRIPNPSPGSDTYLRGVSVTSATNAWAVGWYYPGAASESRTLVEHWNGSSWKIVPSPNVGGSSSPNDLRGVVATSSSNAVAVGTSSSSPSRTLVIKWNGTAWRRVPSPNLTGFDNRLLAVGASSASDIWAVGFDYNGSVTLPLALHCC